MERFVYPPTQQFLVANTNQRHQSQLSAMNQNGNGIGADNNAVAGLQNNNFSSSNNNGEGIHSANDASANNLYRSRVVQQMSSANSIFGNFDDPIIQQAKVAAATLAEMDVKNVGMSSAAAMFRAPADMFSGSVGMPMLYSSSSSAPGGMDFDSLNAAGSSNSIAPMLIDSSSGIAANFHQSAADSMASLQQQVIAMQQHQHSYAGFGHYHPMQSMMPSSTAFGLQQQMVQQHQQQQGSSSVSSAVLGSAASMNSAMSSMFNCSSAAADPCSAMFPTLMNGGAISAVQHARYPSLIPAAAHIGLQSETTEIDQRELERFAEHFKQRRIKLGVTQADVGKALAHLKMNGVQTLSQSTICRFESLTLSQNNMVALKPILQSWLEKAEDAIKHKNSELHGSILPSIEKKRKRTSIAATEKRMLEEYFKQQPRPTSERISAIASKLDLKKNVVRVWFCNQRQKQKRFDLPQFNVFEVECEGFRSQFRNRNQSIGGCAAVGQQQSSNNNNQHQQQQQNCADRQQCGGGGSGNSFRAAAVAVVAAAIKQQSMEVSMGMGGSLLADGGGNVQQQPNSSGSAMDCLLRMGIKGEIGAGGGSKEHQRLENNSPEHKYLPAVVIQPQNQQQQQMCIDMKKQMITSLNSNEIKLLGSRTVSSSASAVDPFNLCAALKR